MPQDEGTPGEPETQEAGGVVVADESSPKADASGAPDTAAEDFWAKVRSTPREQWPEDIRRKGEEDILRYHTRKMQEISDREARKLESVVSRLEQSGITTPDERAAILERVKAGELEAIPDLVTSSLKQQVSPVMDELLKERALRQAAEMHPYVQSKQAEVAEVLRSNPELARLASQDGYRNAPQVLTAIATHIEAAELRAKVQAQEAQIASLQKARSASIPGQTTKAGTPHVPSNGKVEVNSIRDAMRAASLQLGLPIPGERA